MCIGVVWGGVMGVASGLGSDGYREERRQLTSLHNFCRPRKKLGEAWRSPPSA